MEIAGEEIVFCFTVSGFWMQDKLELTTFGYYTNNVD
jgi:hypothetical protein